VTSLAVLPLATLGESENDGLGLALADALITQLGALDGLAVRPIHAVAELVGTDPAAAGRALRTDAVLDGRLQHADGRARVTLQLLRTRDGGALWTGTFTADAANRRALQDALAAQAVRALARELSLEERQRLERRLPRDTAAHEAYLRGRHAARLLDPTLPDALLALGSTMWLYDGDTERAEALFREAAVRGPHLASAHHQLGEFLALTGRLTEGIAHLERARSTPSRR